MIAQFLLVLYEAKWTCLHFDDVEVVVGSWLNSSLKIISKISLNMLI